MLPSTSSSSLRPPADAYLPGWLPVLDPFSDMQLRLMEMEGTCTYKVRKEGGDPPLSLPRFLRIIGPFVRGFDCPACV